MPAHAVVDQRVAAQQREQQHALEHAGEGLGQAQARLRELAADVFRAEVGLHLDDGELERAATPARRLADLEPLDGCAQRLAIEVSLRRGRRTEAVRRFNSYRGRLQRSFAIEPDFKLADLERAAAIAADVPQP